MDSYTTKSGYALRLLVAWLILAPLIGFLLLTFGARLRGPEWLPGVIPLLYLGLTGGILSGAGAILCAPESMRSPIVCVGLAVVSSLLSLAAFTHSHEFERSFPFEHPHLFALGLLLATAIPLSFALNRTIFAESINQSKM